MKVFKMDLKNTQLTQKGQKEEQQMKKIKEKNFK